MENLHFTVEIPVCFCWFDLYAFEADNTRNYHVYSSNLDDIYSYIFSLLPFSECMAKLMMYTQKQSNVQYS